MDEALAPSSLQVLTDANLLHAIITSGPLQHIRQLAAIAPVCKSFRDAIKTITADRMACLSTVSLWDELWEQQPQAAVNERRLACAMYGLLRAHGPSIRTLKLQLPWHDPLGLGCTQADQQPPPSPQEVQEAGVCVSHVIKALVPVLSGELLPNLAELHVVWEPPQAPGNDTQLLAASKRMTAALTSCLSRLPSLKALHVIGSLRGMTANLVRIPAGQPLPTPPQGAAAADDNEADGWPDLAHLLGLPPEQLLQTGATAQHGQHTAPAATARTGAGGSPSASRPRGRTAATAAGEGRPNPFLTSKTDASPADEDGGVMMALQELCFKGVPLDDLMEHPRPPSLHVLLNRLCGGRTPPGPGLQALSLGGQPEAHIDQTPGLWEGPVMLLLEVKGLSALATHAATLQHLDLSGCRLCCHPAWSGLPQWSHFLQPGHRSHVELLREARAQPPVTLLGPLSSLRTANLSNTVALFPMPDQVIGTPLWRPSMLQGLNLRNCPWVSWQLRSGYTPLQPALAVAQQLVRLNVSCCGGLSDDLLAALPSYCPQLQLLDVCYCRDMSAQALVTCCTSYPAGQLTGLGCSGFEDLTDALLATLLQSQGANLTMLGVGECWELSEQGLGVVAQHCPMLSTLYAQGCPGLTPNALAGLVTACRHLQQIEASDCPLADPASQDILAQRPYVYDGDTYA